MIIDFEPYIDIIEEEIETNKKLISKNVIESFKECVTDTIFGALQEFYAMDDLRQDYLTIRLGYECAVNHRDPKNIIWSIENEIQNMDHGYLMIIDRMKQIFQNSIDLLEEKKQELIADGASIDEDDINNHNWNYWLKKGEKNEI